MKGGHREADGHTHALIADKRAWCVGQGEAKIGSLNFQKRRGRAFNTKLRSKLCFNRETLIVSRVSGVHSINGFSIDSIQ